MASSSGYLLRLLQLKALQHKGEMMNCFRDNVGLSPLPANCLKQKNVTDLRTDCRRGTWKVGSDTSDSP